MQMPPEIEASVRGLAADSRRSVQEVYEEVLRAGLVAARKRAFDRELRENIAAGLAGDVVSEEESLARLGDE